MELVTPPNLDHSESAIRDLAYLAIRLAIHTGDSEAATQAARIFHSFEAANLTSHGPLYNTHRVPMIGQPS